VPPRYRPALAQAPLTQSDLGPGMTGWTSSSAAGDTTRDLTAGAPRWLTVTEHFPDASTRRWDPVRDLLETPAEGHQFVTEVEDDGPAYLRFGDGLNGSRPASGNSFTARYRMGNGLAGNVAAQAIAHVAIDDNRITLVSNPLPATGGVDPESIEHVCRSAPFAFLTQERAVTLDDYGAVARRNPGVQRGAARARWTGSWRTVFVSVDRTCGCDVTPEFRQSMLAFLEPFRMAGQDLDVTNPQLVALEIEMHVCVAPAYFRSHVEAALLQVFGNQVLPDGRRGIFHPDNFTFGQPLYLSRLYAAAEGIEGVLSAQITVARRLDQPATDAVATGVLTAEPSEILQLDNDPNYPDRGVFRLDVGGGR
jgi:predicted phage baseplate assembly protein